MQGTQTTKKREIREQLLDKRLELSRTEVRQKSLSILEKVLELEAIKNVGIVCAYVAIKNEVETGKIIDLLISLGKRVFLPKFDSRVGYVFCEFRRWDNLEEGPAGIPQPTSGKYIKPYEINVAIVPGIAFDRKGVRLGYGKGVYDKLLSDSDAIKIGLAYDFQITDSLPKEAHDLAMDMVITENETINSI
ncbi:MAG: 5-formyltetrahydrofolate cyclo-ligase [Candidatus Curtissbacteria bacterium]|nr:5-formyltetrahydrofolate cyclo-ligase [Candidatus Curtissbacteria bacterium]